MEENLSGIAAYIDICTEIEILTLRAEDQERGLMYARRKMHNRLPKVNGSPIIVPLDLALKEYDEALAGLQDTINALQQKEKTRKKMEAAIGNIKGLEQAVEYHRDALELPLGVIAEKLGYSLAHIKRISSRMPRRMKRERIR